MIIVRKRLLLFYIVTFSLIYGISGLISKTQHPLKDSPMVARVQTDSDQTESIGTESDSEPKTQVK